MKSVPRPTTGAGRRADITDHFAESVLHVACHSAASSVAAEASSDGGELSGARGNAPEADAQVVRCDDGVAILTRRAPAAAGPKTPPGLSARQRPTRPSPPNKSMTDETVGGRVPHVGGGIVGRAGGAGSGGKIRPANESG